MSPRRRRAAASDAVDTIIGLDAYAAPAAQPEPVDPRDDILMFDDGTTFHVFLPHPTA
ncbi:hypothetical protein [Embleya sp. MST-111070]|uniref:hypothetical protein n=1 Tax=Embleya sp. MST-111070 TaxID=3398231 RepID=UPI003F738828